MVFVEVRENDDVVDESVIVIAMFFQCFVYEILYVWRGVRIIYKIDIGTFYSFLVDKSKTVFIIGIYYKLEKEVRYIDDCEVFFSSNRINNLLL